MPLDLQKRATQHGYRWGNARNEAENSPVNSTAGPYYKWEDYHSTPQKRANRHQKPLRLSALVPSSKAVTFAAAQWPRASRVKRKLNSTEVIDAVTDLFILRGVPGHIRADNGPKFIAEAVRGWIKAVRAKTAYIELGSPWENGYCEASTAGCAPFRHVNLPCWATDELLNGEIFYSLREAQIIESLRNHYNTKRPHSALGYRPPTPEAI